MGWTLPGQAKLEQLHRESDAFRAKYPKGGAPADEAKAERERYIVLYNAELNAMSPVERELEALNRKTRWLEHDADRHAELMRMLPAPLAAKSEAA